MNNELTKVYLDANAATRTHPEVIEAMLPFFGEMYGNASSVHAFGREAKKHLERSRVKVAALIRADSPEEIVFTSGGTEANNYALKRTADTLKDKGRHIITSSVEHPSVLNVCRGLQEQGFQITYLGVDRHGIIDLDELENSISDQTILISVMSANNETGTLMPVEKIGEIAAQRGVIFHTDAVQFVGKMPFDVKEAGAQLVSMAAHKINGPKGIGALYIKKGTKIGSCQQGGNQEKGHRAGTENIPAIAGFARASEIALEVGHKSSAGIQKLRNMIYNRISSEIGGVNLNGHPQKRLPNTVNISFDSLEGESIVLNLDIEGIAVSTGSACSSGNLEPSHVLESMGVSAEAARGSVRISLDMFTTEDEIDRLMEKLTPVIERLREMNVSEKNRQN